ncbi:MAG TPA: S1 RNA-binding domain-containing protein, partial [Candidatus Bipolaricaulis anaerobius]|nr:S1 RNA-binding domain-containing protein [Candidatus Bipolaricaulis anaerobius]
EISWQRVGHPKEVLAPGQTVRAIVLKVDEEERRISLSLRALQQDPWEEFLEQYSVGSIVSGPITQIKDFGAFVRLTPAVEGLIHVSEISPDRIASPSEALRLGQEVSAKIIGINESKRQVRLSIKKIAEEVEDAEKDRFLTPQAGRETFTLRERLKGLTEEEEGE